MLAITVLDDTFLGAAQSSEDVTTQRMLSPVFKVKRSMLAELPPRCCPFTFQV